MLSQHDRRALADIEAGLRASDPDLARRLERPTVEARPRRSRTRRRVSLAGLILGMLLLTAAFPTHSADLAVTAVIVIAAVSVEAALYAVSRLRHRSDAVARPDDAADGHYEPR